MDVTSRFKVDKGDEWKATEAEAVFHHRIYTAEFLPSVTNKNGVMSNILNTINMINVLLLTVYSIYRFGGKPLPLA